MIAEERSPRQGLLIRVGLLLVCSSIAAWAQVTQKGRLVILPVADGKDIHFSHVFSGNGPAHSRAHRIVQGEEGFLWFATADRLQRYDGYRLQEYAPDLKDPNVFIQSILKDKSGALLAARDQGIGLDNVPFGSLDRYDARSGIFSPLKPHEPWFQAPIADIGQDRNGDLWFSTSQGLIGMNPTTGQTVRFQHHADDAASLSSNLVRSTLETADGSFWVATTLGLDRFDRATAKVVQHIPLQEDLPAPGRPEGLVIHLCEDHNGVLWAVLSYGYPLARVDRQAGEFIFYSLDGTGRSDPIRSGARTIHEDEYGVLWIGTAFNGILKFDRDRTHFVRYRNDPSDPDSPGGDAILTMFEDREESMWVGTNDAGVDRFATRPQPFKRYRYEAGNPNSLDTNYTTTVFEDSRGILWVGSRRALGGLNRKTGQMTFYRKAGGRGELSETWICSVAEDPSGNLWFGSLEQGLNYLDRRTGKFKVYRHDAADPDSISDDRVLRLFVDHNGVLWAGTEKGLNAFNRATQKFEHYLNGMRIRDIAEDARGVLWIAARGTGLVRLDPLTRTSTTYHLSSDKAWAVTMDHTGTLWVGTEKGLNRFDPATERVTTYYESDGLANNSVSHILEDERGNLWISTHYGLSRFDPRDKTFKNYYVVDGLSGDEFYDYSSSWKSPSGEMFFSSNGGLTAFFPRDVVDDRSAPPVLITDFRIFGKPVPIGKNSPLKHPISSTDSIKLSHTQNVISLEFSALSYISPERNRYRYQLVGLDNQWNESQGDHRFITYALPPGEYLFRVQGSNNRGIWNEKGTSVRITILPPWWDTSWFRAGCAALILILLWTIYHLRVRAFEHRQTEIRALNDQLIKAQEAERMRIAGELHDGVLQQITSLTLRLGKVRRQAPPDSEAKATISGLQQQLITIGTDIRHLSHELHPALLQESGLAAALAAYCEEFSTVRGLPVSCATDESVKELSPGAALCIYRIAQEALGNAAKYSEAKKVEVRLTRSDGRVWLSVSDDGVGCSPDQIGKSGGLGLINMRERVLQLDGTFAFDSEPGRGTTVTVTVPFRTDS